MSALFPDEARKNWLDLVAGTGGVNLRVRLFTNTPVMDHTLTLASLVEATYSGYAGFSSTSWGIPSILANDDADILSPVIIFDGPPSPPGQTARGYYVTSVGTSPESLLMAELFATPKPLNLATDQAAFQVHMSLRHLAA